jgi:hypothetical protein
MNNTANTIFIILLCLLLVALGYTIGTPGTPNDDIANECVERGYVTALYQFGQYYCADVLIIEDSYRIEDNEQTN